MPAAMQFEKQSPPPPTSESPGHQPKVGRKARAHHGVSPNSAMEEYFKEGEQKSKEQDDSPSVGANSSAPPPPKAGGPPKA